jgi:prepilin-type N-terminal cleavage/methylation domain-containing protein
MLKTQLRKGFTLAEVLITLLIIGVISSIVIPALIGDTQQAELKVGLKKAVATLNQALAMSIAQDQTDTSTLSSSDADGSLMNLFANKLNVISTDYTNNIITTADGTVYRFFVTSGSACDPATTTVTNADSITVAKCYVLVDVNGTKKPNLVSDGGLYKDQYYLVIRDKTVVPGKSNITAGSDMAQQAMYK